MKRGNDEEGDEEQRDGNTSDLTENDAYEEVYPQNDNIRFESRSDESNIGRPSLPRRDYSSRSKQNHQPAVHSNTNNQSRGDGLNTEDHSSLSEIDIKINGFKANTTEFIEKLTKMKDEKRTAEETFIIFHLLKTREDRSPVLDGQLDQLAMLACCDSSRVVQRALDVLLNEIFLNISNLSRDRCQNILKAEEILRSTFFEFIDVHCDEAKCQRMTTYAWLVTLVLLKCGKEELPRPIQSKIKEFDEKLGALQRHKDNLERSLYRYGIHLARESIRQILRRRNGKESLIPNIQKCENLLKSKLNKNEVLKFCRELSEADSWLDIHVCLVFLQDLPKHYQFQDNPRPVIFLQMLVAHYRERYGKRKFKDFFRISNPAWLFEVLFYRVMLRLIRTSNNKVIIEQILNGEHGCGGVFKNWEKNKSSTAVPNESVAKYCEKLCERAVFISTTQDIEGFLAGRCIEDLSILELYSKHRDKILEIVKESRNEFLEQRVSTYDAFMSGNKCLLKLHLHSKEEILGSESGHTPLREEIEILKILDGNPERCENIVTLFGSSIEAPMHVIVERTTKSDLWTYLQGFGKPPAAKVLLHIARDICKAMIYLGENGIIHRDLCAKNCFVFIRDALEGPLIKLGVFHLAIQSLTPVEASPVKSSVNEYSQNQLAVRWTAVEALRDGEFSFASDVWSFGVLLFEVFTFGSKPYFNMPSGRSLERDDDVRGYVLNGKKLELHPKMPDVIQKIIESTMKKKNQRPTFLALNSDLTEVTFNDDEIYMDPANYKKMHRSKSSTVR
ncbi:uncharacterized protein LOC114534209 [Dendronephthya gigantea]|uniref:uncharacterized protein LOC114534209 n=1 Tax=Dendronephthya gigantea TaxID=151771 RepID=UPI00106B6729|nr:uncharacterized protein LOC114534209 [Dendronephthya gigantea]